MSYCSVCREAFFYEEDLREHEQDEHPYCDPCGRAFYSANTLRQHRLTSRLHNYCGICEREFQSPAALRGHNVTHEPRDIKCPQCSRFFTTSSALAKHVEVGKCYGDFTHSQYVNKIRDWEVRSGNQNLLTVPRLGWSDSSASSGRYCATEAAYNGSAFACYFCSRAFSTLNSLNQHLNSGIHETKDFRCRKCGFDAVWLSGLIEHIESEKCGLMTRGQVRDLATRPFVQLRLGN